jgi:hypothetical protein
VKFFYFNWCNEKGPFSEISPYGKENAPLLSILCSEGAERFTGTRVPSRGKSASEMVLEDRR